MKFLSYVLLLEMFSVKFEYPPWNIRSNANAALMNNLEKCRVDYPKSNATLVY